MSVAHRNARFAPASAAARNPRPVASSGPDATHVVAQHACRQFRQALSRRGDTKTG